MATAKTATKTTAHKSTVRNPSTRLLTGATSKKPATKKKGSTVTKKTATKKNPAQPATRRNPAYLSNEFVVAFGGALAVVGFDIAVNRFFPTVSGLIRTGAKFGVGWAIGKYGKKLPLIGGFSGLIKTGLYIFGALDLVTTYGLPYLNQWLGAPAPVAQPQLVAANVPTGNPGEMGNLYQDAYGQQFYIVDDRAGYIGGNPYAGANPYGTNYATAY
ncbi:MAG TPA: hypothetical protein VF692_07370 [Pyrinomonadaceae bacterium]|jgi:hypothetical protein